MFCRNLLARKSRVQAIGHFDYPYLLNYTVYRILSHTILSVNVYICYIYCTIWYILRVVYLDRILAHQLGVLKAIVK